MTNPIENINLPDGTFSETEIQVVLKTKQNFINGKTTARDWTGIEQDFNQKFGKTA